MFQLQQNIKKLINLFFVTVLLSIQVFSVFFFNRYGLIELYNRNINHQSIKCSNCNPSETLFTKKDTKELQNSFQYFENQKYKHVNKFSISSAELLFVGFILKKNEFSFQEVADNNLIPRSPPQNLT
jgi:hypothetical protein